MFNCFKKQPSSNNNNVPILYYDMGSQPSNAIYWWSKFANIDLKIKMIQLGRGEHMSPEYLKINPRHQVPALKHKTLVLTEAQAIMHYLAELNNCKDKWFGSNQKERAQVQMYLSWYHTNLRQKLIGEYFFLQNFLHYFMGTPKPDNETLQKSLEEKKEVLQHINSFLSNKTYFLGNKLTVVDFLYAEELFTLHFDEKFVKMLENYSNITKWLKNMQKVPHYKEVNSTYNNYLIPSLKEFSQTGNSQKSAQEYQEIINKEEQRLQKLPEFV